MKWMLFIFLLPACAQVDVALKPYVDQFVADAAERNVPIAKPEVRFGSVGTHPNRNLETAGDCVFRPIRSPKVTINEALWAKLGEIERKVLVYHELGHCLLGLPHGKGIMNASIADGARNANVEELFAAKPVSYEQWR